MGLIGTVARTAVIAGTATSVSNRVSRRQSARWAQQGAAQMEPPPPAPAPVQAPAQSYAPPPAPASTPGGVDRIQQLKDLADLKAQGILTDQEFATEKARILNG